MAGQRSHFTPRSDVGLGAPISRLRLPPDERMEYPDVAVEPTRENFANGCPNACSVCQFARPGDGVLDLSDQGLGWLLQCWGFCQFDHINPVGGPQAARSDDRGGPNCPLAIGTRLDNW